MASFELLINRATAATVKSFANLVTELLPEKGGGRFPWGRRRSNESIQETISIASQEYIKRYGDRHGRLQVLGMREPLSLDSMYVAVQLEAEGLRSVSSIADLEKHYRNHREQRLRRPYAGDTRQGMDVINAEPFLLILGAPGSGKSVFLRKAGLEALKADQREFNHYCIPVLIELKQWAESEMNLEQMIANEFETCGFLDADGMTAQALQKGKLLILLDGLDEISTAHRNSSIQAIQAFVDRYSHNRYMVSCRSAAYKPDLLPQFKAMTIAELDDGQIQQFIQNWFAAKRDRHTRTANHCWEMLQRSENAGIKELAHTPLLLTFLCLLYERRQDFPPNRSILYRKALEILLEEWAAQSDRLENHRQANKGLSVELEEILLSDIAARSFVKNQVFFSKQDLIGRFRTFLEDNLNTPEFSEGEAILDTMAKLQGILVKRAEGVYSFSHLSLQAHLAAQYLVDNPQFIGQVVTKYLTDTQWREIFLLIAGLSRSNRGTDGLLLLMEQQAQQYINTPKLKGLLQWAEESTAESKVNYHPVAKQAIAIFLSLDWILDLDLAPALDLALALDLARDRSRNLALALDRNLVLALDRALALASALDHTPSLDLSLARARALDRSRFVQETHLFSFGNPSQLITDLENLRSQVPDASQPLNVQQAFADRLSHLWFGAIQLDPEAARLSEEEATSLSNYLYVNELMVRCKETTMLVSSKTWTAIEARMLQESTLRTDIPSG